MCNCLNFPSCGCGITNTSPQSCGVSIKYQPKNNCCPITTMVVTSDVAAILPDNIRGIYVDTLSGTDFQLTMMPNPTDGMEVVVCFTYESGDSVRLINGNTGQTILGNFHTITGIQDHVSAGQIFILKYRLTGSQWYIS